MKKFISKLIYFLTDDSDFFDGDIPASANNLILDDNDFDDDDDDDDSSLSRSSGKVGI